MQNLDILLTNEQGKLKSFAYEMDAPFHVTGVILCYEDAKGRNNQLIFSVAKDGVDEADATLMVVDLGMAFDVAKGELTEIRELCIDDHRERKMIVLCDENSNSIFKRFCETTEIPPMGLPVNFRSF